MPVLDDLPHVLRKPRGEAAGAIVLLHGQGASEQDLAGLADVLDPQRRLVAASPRGTLSLPTATGFQWYVDREPGFPQRDTFEGAYTILDAWLRLLAETTRIPPEKTLLGGFSQGATVAWGLVLGKGRPRAAGMLALSGFVPRVSDFELDYGAVNGLPVAICHGEADDRVPVDLARTARDRATEAGASVLYRETDVGHLLDLRVVPELQSWVAAALP
jgi:phospholipase/carboxylesterase